MILRVGYEDHPMMVKVKLTVTGDGVELAGNLEHLVSHVVDKYSLLSTCCDQKIWTKRSQDNTVVGVYMPATLL